MDTSGWTRADSRRRMKREQAELIALAESYYTDGAPSYHDSRDITGVPENHNRIVRATESSWISMGRLAWSECIAHKDGVATVFTPSRERANESKRRSIETDAQQKRAEQLASRARAFNRVESHSELASGDC